MLSWLAAAHVAYAEDQGKAQNSSYVVQSQSDCSVSLQVPEGSEDSVGDVLAFQEAPPASKDKNRRRGPREAGRIVERAPSATAGSDLLTLKLAQRNRPKCGDVKDLRIRPVEVSFLRQFSFPWVDLAMDAALVVGFGLETWEVVEDPSGTFFSVGSMFTLEAPRPSRYGLALHGNLLLERASLRNQKIVIVGADAELTTARAIAGMGAGVVYHLDRRALARAEGLVLVETSLFGELETKVFGETIKRDYRLAMRITPAVRFDYTLFSLINLGVLAGYALATMEIEDANGTMQEIDGHAWRLEGTFAYRL